MVQSWLHLPQEEQAISIRLLAMMNPLYISKNLYQKLIKLSGDNSSISNQNEVVGIDRQSHCANGQFN
ncbi:hypothetical protein GCM10010911_20560 [Paenibacillus nasutitermitis]|uniref:Uncharacterized protein n=1 Tax=Paenibacillus nasutitermitis TaxID=1652958 RepID=A0A916YUW3_9BACL|nr:hypothetical protein GCM10010911_20560 [Paenibacillus nasutitermitis]